MQERRRQRGLWRLLPILIPLLVATLWFASHAVAYVANRRVFFIPSGSMSPTLVAGDRIVIDLGAGPPRRGEVWVFSDPNGGTLVKRVVGLPGETIEVSEGRVSIDGKPLDEPYLAAPITYAMPPVRLGLDEYFMLGDSRNTSKDSHVWGPLGKGHFIGRAEQRYRPGSGIGGLE